MKKFLLGAFLGIFALAGVTVLPNYASAADIDDEGGAGGGSNDSSWENPGWDMTHEGRAATWSKLLDSAKSAINWILGILATIALVLCLYAGFLMVTSAGDEKKYQKGLSILKYAALGLAVVGLAWLFVSLISWFVAKIWGGDTVA